MPAQPKWMTISGWVLTLLVTAALIMSGVMKFSNDPQLLEDWRRLTTSDHFYYMCTKYWADGDVHKYFSPYESPYDSYINFMNVLDNIGARVRAS